MMQFLKPTLSWRLRMFAVCLSNCEIWKCEILKEMNEAVREIKIRHDVTCRMTSHLRSAGNIHAHTHKRACTRTIHTHTHTHYAATTYIHHKHTYGSAFPPSIPPPLFVPSPNKIHQKSFASASNIYESQTECSFICRVHSQRFHPARST